jgi:hypothetical protein
MEDTHSALSYFVAIFAVIGGALLMPALPIFVLVVGPLLLLGFFAIPMHQRQ